MLVMAICGGAVVPQLFVHLKRTFDFQTVFWCLMTPSYLYILGYGLMASRGRDRTRSP